MNLKYLNVNGLDKSKLFYLENSIQSLKDDIIVISEHWFSVFQELKASRFFVCSTPMPSIKRHGHQNGGMALLCSQHLRHEIEIHFVMDYFIQFSVKGIKILATYLPPRLNTQEISQIVTDYVSGIDIFLGDINVRFGAQMGDKRIWNMDRGEVLSQILAKYGLSIRPCQTLFSGNDHVYSKSSIKWKYSYYPGNEFKTDHGFIQMELSGSCKNKEAHSLEGEKRYAFSVLKDPILKEIIKQDWIPSQTILMEVVGLVRYKIKTQEISTQDQINGIIDVTYDLFISELLQLCEKHFPAYHAESIKSSEDKLALVDNPSNSEIIRMFKRSQRAFSQQQIFIPSGTDDIFTETYNHFSMLYKGEYSIVEDEEPVCYNSLRIDPSDILKTLKKYSSAKSGGPDGISTRLLKCLSEVIGFDSLLAELFNLFLETSTSPVAWNLSKIHLLFKDPENPFIKNSRPVSLTNILRRLFEKLLLRKMINEPWAELHPNQAGFRKGWSTNSHILLNDELSRSHFSITAFLDMKNAFDTVDHKCLQEILKKRMAPKWAQKLIFSLMIKNCRSIISVNKIPLQHEIKRTRGVFQGSILSPFLFNLIIDDLAQTVDRHHSSVKILLFADDIAIKANCWISLQAALDECLNWSSRAKTIWGIKKCGILSKGEYHPVLLGDEVVQQMDIYKYLGVPFSPNGVDWRLYLDQITSKFRKFLGGISTHKLSWNYSSRIQIYKTFIRPIMEYCLPLLTSWIAKQEDKNKLMDQLSNLHKDGIAWIFDKHAPLSVLESLSGLGSLSFRIKQLKCSLANHIRTLDERNPLNFLWKSNFISANKNFLLSSVRSSKILTDWKSYQKREKFQLKFVTWLKHEKYRSSLESQGILQHYILNQCRGRSGIDRCLYFNLKTSRQALSWRCNRSFSRSICPVCSEIFNRAHLERCNLYNLMDLDFQELLDSNEYKRDVKHIMESTKEKTFVYTLLDYFLNSKQYGNFFGCYQRLRELLFDGKILNPSDLSSH